MTASVPFAIVHHANQYLIGDGYESRQGLSEIVSGYGAVLTLHERYAIPANLHLSGTLVEAAAWRCPTFLSLVRRLCERRVVSLVGGTYADHVATLFPPDFNERALNELLWLYRHHLGCAPTDVGVAWIAERVWDTALLAPVLTAGSLANSGYRAVLLDDRLHYASNGSYEGSPRARFDGAAMYTGRVALGEAASSCATPRIAGTRGLVMLPISSLLRYLVPPAAEWQWCVLEEFVARLSDQAEGDALLVYADDLERTAGVGGWERGTLPRYERFMAWLAGHPRLRPVHLDEWLGHVAPSRERVVERGAFYELAQRWRAGEDYRGWWDGPAWSRHRDWLLAAQDAVRLAQREGADTDLVALAWKHLLASTYETAWHEVKDGEAAPAPWAKALASHARSCLVLADAARRLTEQTGSSCAEVVDVDDDGEPEALLRNDHFYAIVAPRRGARVVSCFARAARGGVSVIGNPSDDWNFQEELNRYMDLPANHPGALADVGFEHDRYDIVSVESGPWGAFIEHVNVQEGSPLAGARKSLLLQPNARALVVCYRLPEGLDGLSTRLALSPDYGRLLREGAAVLSREGGRTWQGARSGCVAIWVACPGSESFEWEEPDRDVGHAFVVRVRSRGAHFHLVVGCGEVDERTAEIALADSRDILHSRSQRRVLRPAGALTC